MTIAGTISSLGNALMALDAGTNTSVKLAATNLRWLMDMAAALWKSNRAGANARTAHSSTVKKLSHRIGTQ